MFIKREEVILGKRCVVVPESRRTDFYYESLGVECKWCNDGPTSSDGGAGGESGRPSSA